jgi:hypothetical protein
MRAQHLIFLDCASYLPMLLRKLPVAFGLAVSKYLYPHYFNAQADLDYVAAMPD